MAQLTSQLNALRIERGQADTPAAPRRLLLPAAVLLALASAGAALWWHGGAAALPVPAATAPAVQPAPAAATAAGRLVASGFVVARRRATVAAEVTGRIEDVLVEEGQAVKAGQLLAVLDDRVREREVQVQRERAASGRASVEAAEIDLADARLTLERDSRLAQTGFVSPSATDKSRSKVAGLQAQLVRARAEARATEADLARMQTELSQYRIVAPFAGVVLDKNAQPGEIVSPVSGGGGFTRTGICTIVDMDSLELQAEINEANLGQVAVGGKVDVTLDAYPGVHWAARVLAIVPAANRDRASVRVRLSFDAPDRRILPDMAAKLAFEQSNLR